MEKKDMHKPIEESFKNAFTYEAYEQLIEDLLVEGKSTAPEQGADLTEYSELNLRRMRRWDKRLKVSSDVQEKVGQWQGEMHWLVLSEGWCGDAAHSVPVMAKLASLNSGISFRVLLRDQNEALMEHFLTNGGKSIPKLIVYDPNKKEVLDTWGPRPTQAQRMLEDYKQEHGSLDDVIKELLQVWYNRDKGVSIAEELSALLK